MKRVLLGAAVAFAVSLAPRAAAQSGALVPYGQTPHTDKAGNEWNIEQNGMLNRPGSGNSIISGCASLQVGNQQFYCNQPMITPDGRELVMQSGQPMGAVSVTRRIRYLDKEGGVRYIEQFTNSLGRDTTITVEVRHNFNNSGRAYLSDRARPSTSKLEENESGIIVLPGQGNAGSPSLLFTVSTPRAGDKPRIQGRNQYQLSFFHTLTIPAGKTASIVHTIGQAKTSIAPDEEELQKLFRPLALTRTVKDIPRDIAATIVNLKSSTSKEGLQEWFPAELWGIKPETFDVLAIGDATRLKGKATCAKLSIHHPLGDLVIPWNEVAALAGSRFSGPGRACLWLRDGCRLTGQVETQELRFTLVSGLGMDLKLAELDRLVLSTGMTEAKWPDGIAALLETLEGDRHALTAVGATLPMVSLWGEWRLDLKNVLTLAAPEDDAASALARMKDGSRIRLMPAGGAAALQLKRFGTKTLPIQAIRQLITTEAAAQQPDDDEDPMRSFVELAGGQRLIARVTGANVRLATSGGPVELSPASIREMRDVTEEQDEPGTEDERLYQAALWGGGNVVGRSAGSLLQFEGEGFSWKVPVRHVVRIANPVPKIEAPVMARIGTLIRELGDDSWKTREHAGSQLKELGALALPSLREALKQSTDAEVTRRIEELLESIE